MPRTSPWADKARTVWRQTLTTKSGFPIMAIKAVLSAINIFSPRDSEEKNAPLTDTAGYAGRADLLKKRPVSLVDPPHHTDTNTHTHSPPAASPLFAFFPLYMSQYLEDLRRGGAGEGCVCVCIVEVLPGDSIPCWWCVWGGVGGG